MRRVEILKWEIGKKVGSGEYGWFHAWGVSYEEYETGPGNFSTAIIEKPDGMILNVHCGMIRFLDIL